MKMIDVATEGIFKTQFYDQVSTMEFSSLEYPEKYSVPLHPPRDGVGAYCEQNDDDEMGEEQDAEMGEQEEEEMEQDVEEEVEDLEGTDQMVERRRPGEAQETDPQIS